MTLIMEPSTSPLGVQEELAASLEELLDGYLTLLSAARSGAWSKVEEDLVRRARAALIQAGHTPVLGHETTSHLDYKVLDGSV